MATWPTTLPAPSRYGYGLESGDPTVRTDMDAGAARVRRRFTASPDTVNLKFVFNDAQMATFRTTWAGDMAQGAAWINLPIRDGNTGGVVNHEIRPNPARFTAQLLGAGIWAVSFSAEVRHA